MARLSFQAAKDAIQGSLEHAMIAAAAVLVSGQNPDGTPARGTFDYKSGTVGTVNVPVGARVLSIQALGGATAGSVVIGGGDAITVPASVRWDDSSFDGSLVGAKAIVFANTAGYYVSWEL